MTVDKTPKKSSIDPNPLQVSDFFIKNIYVLISHENRLGQPGLMDTTKYVIL